MALDSSEELRCCLRRLQAGEPQARDELVSRTCDQLRRLTRKMLRDYARLRRWEESDDILQNATLRLYRSLQEVVPQDLPGFFQLAALQIRRELIDLARHYYGPEGLGAKHATQHKPPGEESGPQPVREVEDPSYDPRRLVAWTEFHQQIERLPAEDRAVFDLLWYQGLTQEAAADLLAISPRTIKRRWQSARLKLHQALQDVQQPL